MIKAAEVLKEHCRMFDISAELTEIFRTKRLNPAESE